jgi:hypothetical protein
LFVIAPDGPVYAHLVLSELAAQKAKVGQAVSLQLLSRAQTDSPRLQGTIAALASAPVPINTDKGTDQGYSALVLLDSQSGSAPLLGARVEARLQTETKSLLHWLFEPLFRGLTQTTLKRM